MKIEERFWAKVDKTGSCWTWTAGKFSEGYGAFWVAGRVVQAHRFAYELLVGPISKGLVTDHLCRNRACVNPSHLETVTQRINILRGVGVAAVSALKTECVRGHPLDGANLYVPPNGWRQCRECRSAARRRYYARKAGAA